MIKTGDTSVVMQFDNGRYLSRIELFNKKLIYPNEISKDLKNAIEISIAIVVDKIINAQSNDTETFCNNQGNKVI